MRACVIIVADLNKKWPVVVAGVTVSVVGCVVMIYRSGFGIVTDNNIAAMTRGLYLGT